MANALARFRLCRACERNASVGFIGPPECDLQVMPAADAFVMPNIPVAGDMEGFGLVCLASASGGAADLVRHGVEGFLIPPGEDLRLAEALGLLHSDRSLLARMGLAGLERARKHPSWESTGAKIRDFLVAVAGQRRTESAGGGLV